MTYIEACEFLGVQIDTSLAECKIIYRRLAQHYHPDRGGSAEKFKTLTEAYRIFEHHRPQMDEMQLQRQRQRQSSAASDFKTNGANGRAKPHRQPRSETHEEEEAKHQKKSYVGNWGAALVLVVLVGFGYLFWDHEQLLRIYIVISLTALAIKWTRYIVRFAVNLLIVLVALGCIAFFVYIIL